MNSSDIFSDVLFPNFTKKMLNTVVKCAQWKILEILIHFFLDITLVRPCFGHFKL